MAVSKLFVTLLVGAKNFENHRTVTEELQLF